MSASTSPSNEQERLERLERLEARAAELQDLRTRVRKLSAAFSRMAITQGSEKKLALLSASIKYVNNFEDVPTKLKTPVKCMLNELQSLREGIHARLVRPEDLVLTSSAHTLKAIDTQAVAISAAIKQLSAAGGNSESDEDILRKNARYRNAIKPFGDKDFQIARVPVTFTFQNKQKHSQVGYIDNDRLEMLGFKSANLGGYTVLYDQLVVGINPRALHDRVEDPETGKVSLVQKTHKVATTKFHDGKPVKVMVKRPKELSDLVEPILKKLEAQTRHPWTLMNTNSASAHGVEGQWFWLMPTSDVKRLSAAFPGGFFKVAKWGLAF
jgi:uncharacterized protein (DUF2147 family)